MALLALVTTSAVVSGMLALGMQATLGNIVGGMVLQVDGVDDDSAERRMRALSLGAVRVKDALRAVTGLGAHRYVAGRLHLVHAMAFAAVSDGLAAAGDEAVLAQAKAWAAGVLRAAMEKTGPALGSRGEGLWRRSTEGEVAAVLDAFWTPGARAEASRAALRALLDASGVPPGDSVPFDELAEPTMHPLLVDSGWELLPLRELDPERHRGAIAAFGDALSFASACLHEDGGGPPLLELPALGPCELLGGATDDGTLVEPFVVWAAGNETYIDYLVRGVRRAARLPDPEG